MATSELQFDVLGTQVAQILRAEIVAGRRRDGEHLVEAALSERFGVSRGPIRDALQQLSAEGMVEIRRRGSFVVGLSQQDISELYSLRASLEGLASRLVIERRDSIPWSKFEATIGSMAKAAETRDVESFAAADLRFHELFYRHAQHRRLLNMWSQIVPTFRALLDFTNSQDRDLHPALASHKLILRLAMDGDVDATLTELTRHLSTSEARITTARLSLLSDKLADQSETK